MEPLSVTASIAGLVTLAELVFTRVFKYVHAVKGASGEISALSSEVGALYGVLNNLHLVSCQLEDESFLSTARVSHINSCTRTLQTLHTILDKDSTSSGKMAKIEIIKRKLHWPFTSSEVQSLLAEIERHKSTLTLALNADSMLGFVQSLSVQGAILETVDGIRLELKQRHEAVVRIALDVKRQKILDSFSKINPHKNQKMSSQLRQPGTGLWLLESQEFHDWVQTDGSRLWLYGIPGAGKTVLAATVIEEALRMSNTSHAVAFFYCDFNTPATQKPDVILGSLVQQLAKQDEQSFQKVQTFCDRRNPDYRDDIDYDHQELRDLILDVALCFDCATIIVDGLDECGLSSALVTELLSSLSLDLKDDLVNVKTLFLSRDEIDIRDHLNSYTHLAIDARIGDLKLYVGAEIETRMRKNRLRIKDPSLKGYIMEKLVNGAEGIRRKALGNLPPTLNATYERILRRVNASNRDVQILVSRALKWIMYELDERNCFDTAALCEAISINSADTERDSDKISDNSEILRWCSSLVRQATDSDYLELAHFTVQEFLQGISPEESGEFVAYRAVPDCADEELAKVCLTYLNFRDFNNNVYPNNEYQIRRLENSPFREYAVAHWHLHAQCSMDNGEVFSLAKRFLDPSKPGTLISWAQDMVYLKLAESSGWEKVYLEAMSAIAEASALHFAAIFFNVFGGGIWKESVQPTTAQQYDVINVFVIAGADLHRSLQTLIHIHSPLFLSLYYFSSPLAMRLLEEGSMLDDECFNLLEMNLDRALAKQYGAIIDHVKRRNVHEKDIPTLLRLQIAVGKDTTSKVTEDLDWATIDYGPSLRAAAQYGRIQVITQMLGRGNVDVDAVDKDDGTTPLHLAAMAGHLDIVKTLISHGAEPKWTDYKGRAAIHHAIRAGSSDCLEYFLEEASDEVPQDMDGYSVWHLAALEYGKQRLEILARYLTPTSQLSGLRTSKGWSPLSCAASIGSTEGVEWLLEAGCDIKDVASDGSSALHFAVAAHRESLETARVLLAKGCDVKSRSISGENSLMITARHGRADVLDLLISKGGDLKALDKDGCSIAHYACAEGSLSMIKRLKHTTIDWNTRGTYNFYSERWTGVSPLHIAAANVNNEILEYLIDEGLISDINAITEESITALYIAAFLSLPLNVSALLSRNADPTIKGARDYLPAHVAAVMGNSRVVSVFLQYDCDVEIPDSEGLDCEMKAMRSGHKSVAKLFREHKAKRAACIDTANLRHSPVSRLREKSRALKVAIDIADVALCKEIIEDGVDLSIGFAEGQGYRPLLYILRISPLKRPAVEIAEFLASRAASIEGSICDASPVRGYTVIHFAAAFNYFSLLQILLDKHPMAILELKTHVHPIHLATQHGNIDCAKLLIDHYRRCRFQMRDAFQLNWFQCAIHELVDLPVGGATLPHPWYTNNYMRTPVAGAATPLHNAATVGDYRIARFLLDQGANVHAIDMMSLTPLHYAAANNNTTMAELLLSFGANTNAVDKRLKTACMFAAQFDNLEALQLMVAKGADLRSQDELGRTALFYAADCDSLSVVAFIVSHGHELDLGCCGSTYYSPAFLILSFGSSNALQYLLNLAPNPRIYAETQFNVLTACVRNHHMTRSLFKKFLRRLSWPIVTKLLRERARAGGTPLYAICTLTHPSQQQDLLDTLLETGADIEHVGGDHGTPLTGACATGKLAAVKLLVARGANIAYKNDDGAIVSALDKAKHFPEIVRWLLVERFMQGPRRILG
ncbi:MAG: hypothetical protein Q9170_003178 [Blastenia crenularia]